MQATALYFSLDMRFRYTENVQSMNGTHKKHTNHLTAMENVGKIYNNCTKYLVCPKPKVLRVGSQKEHFGDSLIKLLFLSTPK